jgi:hypothetical protein
MSNFKIFYVIANGYRYDVYASYPNNEVRVYANDTLVATAKRDTAVEQVFATYFANDGEDQHDVEVPQELYWKNDPRALAEWLVAGFFN